MPITRLSQNYGLDSITSAAPSGDRRISGIPIIAARGRRRHWLRLPCAVHKVAEGDLKSFGDLQHGGQR